MNYHSVNHCVWNPIISYPHPYIGCPNANLSVRNFTVRNDTRNDHLVIWWGPCLSFMPPNIPGTCQSATLAPGNTLTVDMDSYLLPTLRPTLITNKGTDWRILDKTPPGVYKVTDIIISGWKLPYGQLLPNIYTLAYYAVTNRLSLIDAFNKLMGYFRPPKQLTMLPYK